MAYHLNEVVIRTNNSEEGMARIGELWTDIFSGKIPVLFDSNHQPAGGMLVSRYSNYESNEQGAYDLGIFATDETFFSQMESKVGRGYIKFEEVADEVGACTKAVWEAVWKSQAEHKLDRAYTKDYEVSVPAEIAPDHRAHCTLYIAVN